MMFDPAAVLSTILSASPVLLLLALAVYSITFLILSLRWRRILHALGVDLPLVSALSLIPVTISGLGLVEGGLAVLLAGVGVPAAAGVSIALMDRAITVAFHILVGARAATRALPLC